MDLLGERGRNSSALAGTGPMRAEERDEGGERHRSVNSDGTDYPRVNHTSRVCHRIAPRLKQSQVGEKQPGETRSRSDETGQELRPANERGGRKGKREPGQPGGGLVSV